MNYSESEFVCLDAFTGALVWSLPIEAYAPRESVAIAYGNLYLIPGYIEEDTMNSYVTLDEVWAIGSKSWPMWRGDSVNTAVGQSAPTNATLRWKFTTGGGVVSSPSIVDGRVYVGSQDKNVYCLDARNGRLVWNYLTGARIKSSPAVVDGKVYIGPDDGYVYCLDAVNGSVVWMGYAGGYVDVHLDSVTRLSSSPAVVDEKVYVGALDANVYCFDAYSGNLTWNYTTAGPISSSPAVVDGAVYIVSQEPSSAGLYKLDASDGTRLWKLEIPYKVIAERGTDMHASPVVADGLVFAAANKDRYYAVDAETGDIVWVYDVTMGTESGGGFLVGSMSYHDGNLFVVDQFFVTCLKAEDGTPLWKSWLGGEIYVSPTYADGKIYVATDRRAFYVLNASDGDRLSYFATGSSCWSSPSIYEGRVYIGNQDWNVYCLDDSPVMSGQISGGFVAIEIEVGEPIMGGGQLSLPIAYAPVDVFFMKPDGSVDCIQVSAGSNGSFSFDYVADVVGVWSVSVWCSGASYIMSTEGLTITVVDNELHFDPVFGMPIEYFATLVVLLIIAVITLIAYLVIKRKGASSPVLIND
jgi:outer membrane protein assembly factor BamB